MILRQRVKHYVCPSRHTSRRAFLDETSIAIVRVGVPVTSPSVAKIHDFFCHYKKDMVVQWS